MNIVIAILLGLLSFAAYVATLSAGLLPGDSGEFQTLAYLLSVPHTTGYSVYLMMAKLFTFLPVGEIAYRVNLFSAFMGGVTIALLYLCGIQLTCSRWASAAGAVAVAISATFWSQAVIAEVYTTGSAFVAAIVWLVLLFYRQERPRYLFLAGLLGGLGVGVHGTITLLSVAVAFLLLTYVKRWKTIWLPAIGGALSGALLMVVAFFVIDSNRQPYSMFNAAYIPAASAWDVDPASLEDPLQRFLFIVGARQWSYAMLADPENTIPKNATLYFQTLPKDFAWPLLLLAVTGLVILIKREWKFGVFMVLAVVANLAYTFSYRIADLYVFFLSNYVYLGVLISCGVAAMLDLSLRLSRRLWMRAAVGVFILLVTVLPWAGSRMEFIRQREARFDFENFPNNSEAWRWHKEIGAAVHDLPPNSMAFLDWGDLYPYNYVAFIEQGRSDLYFLEPLPYSYKLGMATTMRRFILENRGRRPIYFAHPPRAILESGVTFTEEIIGGIKLYLMH